MDAFNADMPTRVRLLAEGSLAVSGNDGFRRAHIMRRRPEKFASMSTDQRQNFVTFGVSNRDGHLEGNCFNLSIMAPLTR